jgi:hypothetical protein
MTLDGYTITQLREMHRVAFEDASAAFARLDQNLEARRSAPYPSPAHSLAVAVYPALRAAAEEKVDHMLALSMEIDRRYAAADQADLDKIARVAARFLS